MRRKSVHVYLTVAIAAFLLSIGQGMVVVSHSPLVNAAPNPQSNPHYSAAVSRLEQEDLQGAMTELDRAIQLDPSLAEAYTLRGVLFMGEKNFPEATEDFAQVTRLQPNSAEAHLNFAKSQLMLKDYEGALQSATKAKQLDPENQDAALFIMMIPKLADPSQ